ncbi:MAG: PH domain-containing protein [Solirubrobacterales bacterium]
MDLQSGERVIYQGHPSWRAILGFYLKGAAVGATAGVLAALIQDSTGLGILIFAVVLGITILAGFVKRVATVYTITDRRLNIKHGIVARKVQETRLQRVQNVNYSQGAYQRVMQIGDVDFDTAAGDDYNFVFAGVSQPEQVVEQVDRATHGVTDLDGTAESPQRT